MILWRDGAHDPAENMRRDAALLAAAESGAPPVLRLFAFRPHGITLGASQRAERELDLARCAADGVPWAVRPTGGRAIFHAEEWTYAFACALADPDWGGSRDEAYGRVSALLVASLRRLGVPAALVRHAGPRTGHRPGATAAACFSATARHEIVLDGRKLVGSAQRRTAGAILQQGSVLLGDGHLRLADYLAAGDAQRARVREELDGASVHAGDRLGRDAGLDRWAEALAPELGSRSRRLDGAEGAFLLTLSNDGSYTRPLSQMPQ